MGLNPFAIQPKGADEIPIDGQYRDLAAVAALQCLITANIHDLDLAG